MGWGMAGLMETGMEELLLDNEILMGLVGNVQGRERLCRHCLRSEIGIAGAHRFQ